MNVYKGITYTYIFIYYPIIIITSSDNHTLYVFISYTRVFNITEVTEG